MFAYVQIIDHNNVRHENCFQIKVKSDILNMKYIGGNVGHNLKIPIVDMQNLAITHNLDSDQITFSYDNHQFVFIENGYGEINYLENNLKLAAWRIKKALGISQCFFGPILCHN